MNTGPFPKMDDPPSGARVPGEINASTSRGNSPAEVPRAGRAPTADLISPGDVDPSLGNHAVQVPRPMRVQSPRQIPPDTKTARMAVEGSLVRLGNLQVDRDGPNRLYVDEQIRLQRAELASDLRALREEVSHIVRGCESHRWRRWVEGGIVASAIPAIRALWHRPRDDHESSNDTEYAFRKSRSLINRMLGSGGIFGKLGSFTFFIFAIVYIFKNEVTLRVARTVRRRLKKLSVKLERGDADITESDLRLLTGWRWRVLL